MRRGFLHTSSSRLSLLSAKSANSSPVLEGGKFCIENFSTQRLLGKGNFSEVFCVTDKNKNKDFALKIFNKDMVLRLKKVADVRMERHCLLKLNSQKHPNIIQMIDTFKDETSVYILYELANEGELWDTIKYGGCSNAPLARYYIAQLVNAVEYIHSKNIVHRDLKAENLVINNGVLKLIDFGSALDLDDSQVKESTPSSSTTAANTRCTTVVPGRATTQSPTASSYRSRPPLQIEFPHYVGTAQFMPPESIHNNDSGLNRDLWSLGCTIYQIIAGYPPFQASTEWYIYNKILKGKIVFPPEFPPVAEALVRSLIQYSPSERLGANNTFHCIKEHPYFEGIDFFTIHETTRPVIKLRHLCFKRMSQKFHFLCDNLREKIQAEKEAKPEEVGKHSNRYSGDSSMESSSRSSSFDISSGISHSDQKDTENEIDEIERQLKEIYLSTSMTQVSSQEVAPQFTNSRMDEMARSNAPSGTTFQPNEEKVLQRYEKYLKRYTSEVLERFVPSEWITCKSHLLQPQSLQFIKGFEFQIKNQLMQDSYEAEYAEEWFSMQKNKRPRASS
ncbi:AGC kinase [Cardiosporidium cionae]|uniref:non-specific serine/threonine protein kinase n=1 Tax=Cardiosporidium cionae TaxID=476202 RepID=A0ABQ7J9D3_9APIC|nr:AGC kinase [Cardiosporidium cionae]|eukprot:KAF8820544.1 AGC kinase [Cardiosporidium cionae]